METPPKLKDAILSRDTSLSSPLSVLSTPDNLKDNLPFSTPHNIRIAMEEYENNDSHLFHESKSGGIQESVPNDIPKQRSSKRSLGQVFNIAAKKKRGRPAYHEKFPEIVTVATNFLEERGLAAHERRREDTPEAIGASATDLRLHLIDKVEDLPFSYSISSTRRLMHPPHEGRNASKYYKGLVNAKLGKKTNSQTDEHICSHYLRSRVKYAMEFGTMFPKDVQVISADAKDKLKIGGPVVSRYIRVKNYSLLSDHLEIPDHDFPSGPGYKLTPDGYMFLQPKQPKRKRRNSASDVSVKSTIQEASSRGAFDDMDLDSFATLNENREAHVTNDNLGRTHLCVPRTGPLHIRLRAQKLSQATVVNHLTDLYQLLEGQHKPCLVIVCDNGPDWSKTSIKTVLSMGRLWRDLGLDYLCVIAYAPRDSKFNPIEHAWSPVTSWLSQVVTSATLPGESVPPFKQQITLSEIQEKEQKLFKVEGERICASLNGRYFDTHPVSCQYTHTSPLYDDEDTIRDLTGACKRKLRESPKLQAMKSEYKALVQHCKEGRYSIEFVRCENSGCEHCVHLPPKSKAANLIKKGGGHLFVPTWSDLFPSNYMTFLDQCGQLNEDSYTPLPVDEGLPTVEGKSSFGICEIPECSRRFYSKVDKKRHLTLVHDH